ncbi:hypothetical protein Y032_0016g3091 [Ancylostoma ceylanicum]|uniref:Uncharacterized protein n=1 Tax=Ancylostoma ceylanicum TaxID=53326 RepID=A0A016V7T9_9BILA|nr:hypothetical protein Y032_0016g3091 [Ancylostoma ceylanicum]
MGTYKDSSEILHWNQARISTHGTVIQLKGILLKTAFCEKRRKYVWRIPWFSLGKNEGYLHFVYAAKKR